MNILFALIGAGNAPKHDLRKRERVNQKFEDWAMRNAHILLPVSIVVLILLFVAVCFAICGVSAVESGSMRNFIAGGV